MIGAPSRSCSGDRLTQLDTLERELRKFSPGGAPPLFGPRRATRSSTLVRDRRYDSPSPERQQIHGLATRCEEKRGGADGRRPIERPPLNDRRAVPPACSAGSRGAPRRPLGPRRGDRAPAAALRARELQRARHRDRRESALRACWRRSSASFAAFGSRGRSRHDRIWSYAEVGDVSSPRLRLWNSTPAAASGPRRVGLQRLAYGEARAIGFAILRLYTSAAETSHGSSRTAPGFETLLAVYRRKAWPASHRLRHRHRRTVLLGDTCGCRPRRGGAAKSTRRSGRHQFSPFTSRRARHRWSSRHRCATTNQPAAGAKLIAQARALYQYWVGVLAHLAALTGIALIAARRDRQGPKKRPRPRQMRRLGSHLQGTRTGWTVTRASSTARHAGRTARRRCSSPRRRRRYWGGRA